MFAYIIKSCLLLAILYGAFALLLSRETFHRLNRLALLSVMVASLVLPAIQITVTSPFSLLGSASEPLNSAPSTLPLLGSASEPLTLSQTEAFQSDENVALPQRGSGEGALGAIYLFGLFASLAIFFVQLFRL